MGYVDGFMIPLKKRNIARYRRFARRVGLYWMKYGALEYRESVGEDLNIPGVVPFPRRVKLKRGETLVFSWIVYRSRAHRDRVNAKVMNHPKILQMAEESKEIFDPKRVVYGGFELIVDL